jgi:peroxiredoxin
MSARTVVSLTLFFVMTAGLSAETQIGFTLRDSTGAIHTATEWQQRGAVVLLFISSDCPISNRYAPTINALVKEYVPANTAFYAVQSDPDITAEAARQYAQEYGFQFPVLLDPYQTIASRYSVLVTPTAVVVSGRGELLYRGRIDDRAVDLGKWRNTARKQDLRDAIANVLVSKAVGRPFPDAIGCFLPQKRTK